MLYAFARHGGGETIACLLNLSDEACADWRVPLPAGVGTGATAETLVHTDWQPFGGDTPEGTGAAAVEGGALLCALPPQSGALVRLG